MPRRLTQHAIRIYVPVAWRRQHLEFDVRDAFEGGADPDAHRILDATGSIVGAESSLPAETLLAGYRLMLFSRLLDERAVSLQRQGRSGTYPPARGQEAVVAGTALALDAERDWMVPQYRESAALVHHGYPLDLLLLYFMGNPAGAGVPEGINAMPPQIALAAQLPHAVGLGWGLRLQGRDGVVLTYCGDGGSSEGDFHEALNLAGIVKAPVVFVLVNNGYAISTPRSIQTAASSFAARAEGYGMPGRKVDGNDFIAVLETVTDAVLWARDGGGPTLIEAQTYRLFSHNTADDQTRYVSPAELEQRQREDPIVRMRTYLEGRGLLTAEADSETRDEITGTISAAVERAEAHRKPVVEQLVDHVYGRSSSRVVGRRDQSANEQKPTT